jgi:hypothetical protein
MDRSDQTSIKAVRVHLHVRHTCNSGYISCAISALPKPMVTDDVDGHEHNAIVRCAQMTGAQRADIAEGY